MAERLVVVSGVGAIERNLDRVAEECFDFYNADEVEAFTFAKATTSQAEQLRRAVRFANEIVTHSGGMLAVSSVWESPRPDQRLLACSPPIPSTRLRLVAQAVGKIPLTHIRQALAGPSNERSAHLRTLWPFLVGSSLQSLGQGRLKKTADYDAFLTGAAINRASGSDIGLVYATHDEFFQPTDTMLEGARAAGIYASAAWEGHHNDFMVNPSRVLGSSVVGAFLNR